MGPPIRTKGPGTISVRARHNLDPYGYPGWAAIAQFESLVEVAAVPTERAAFGTRDSFLGMESPWGTIKAGKADTPYKKATAKFDPFSATLGDYNSIMGNTGGDLRAEFDWRAAHAIWYELPVWNGFQASIMVSPGQNTAKDNSDFALGDFNCPATSSRGSGSGFPLTSAPEGCTDGSYCLPENQVNIPAPLCKGTGFPKSASAPAHPGRRIYPVKCKSCQGKGKISETS